MPPQSAPTHAAPAKPFIQPYVRPVLNRPDIAVALRPTGRRFGAMLDTVFCMAVVSWFAAVMVPVIFLDTPGLDNEVASDLRFVPVAAVLLAAAGALNVQRWADLFRPGQPSPATIWWPIGIAAGIMFVSAASARPLAVVYALLLAFVCLSFRIFWSLPERQRRLAFRAAAAIALLSVLAPVALYRVDDYRNLGGIHPNLYGTMVIALGILSLLGFGQKGWLAFPLCYALAIYVSSRYTLAALTVSALVVMATTPRISRGTKMALTLLGLGFVGALATNDTFITRVLALNDAERGLGSGMTGRFDMWSLFLPQLLDAPLVGYGFRMRDAYEMVHNGYLTTLLENGVVLGGLIILWVLSRAAAAALRVLGTERTEEQSICAAAIAGILLGSFFQPQLINFGDAMGVLFLLMLSAPFAAARVRHPALPPGRAAFRPGRAAVL